MFKLTPINAKRLHRFRRTRRAWVSLWLLVALYLLGLAAELICNSNPYYVRYQGESYFPFMAAYTDNFGPLNKWFEPTWGIHPSDTFLGDGVNSPADYKAVARSETFQSDPDATMIWPPVPFGASEIVREADLNLSYEVTVSFAPFARSATLDVTPELEIVASTNSAYFFGLEAENESRNKPLTDFIKVPQRIQNALKLVFANEKAPAVSMDFRGPNGEPLVISTLVYEPRAAAPKKRRLRIEEPPPDESLTATVVIARDGSVVSTSGDFWDRLSPAEQEQVRELAATRREQPLDPRAMTLAGESRRVTAVMEDFAFPFRPVGNHIMGIDDSGRDVFARILYALRIAMNFGFTLVTATFLVGIVIGAIQGYWGGWLDITWQRLIEIWSAIPFLYMIILFGSIFGRSFILLLVIYAIFNWIGISYFMRAEFLKLRQSTYVDAARVMGIANWKIMLRHILPNALVPIITFYPFSLVSAISALSALDYLGFGLPPPTPSWGELLNQYQANTSAWWLVVYPFAILFIVVLLGVLIGEGIRNAFDPRSRVHLE